jgi:two-component system KDP operon response regulator KdpE
MTSGRILVASETTRDRREWRAALEFEGHRVDEVEIASDVVPAACSGLYDILLLDAEIQGAASYELCRAIRSHSELRIIVVNGDHPQSPIDALNAGADDYVPAPLVLPELLARIRAILRRLTGARPARRILLQDRAIDLNAHQIRGPVDQIVHLTPKECSVLEFLIAHADQPLAHQHLAQAVWERDGQGEIEFLRVVIQQLRRKLEPDPSEPRYIVTERAFGYRFQLHPAAASAVGRPRGVKARRCSSPAARTDTPAMAR